MPIERAHLADGFRGCLLGLALGDALGAPFEGLTGETIYRSFGPARGVFDHPPVDRLIYSDDTEMMISVAECLVEHGRIDQDDLAGRFHRHFTPTRGYGPGMRKIAEAMNTGRDWRAIVQTVFPGGSFGNGAAMRVAPVGLVFHEDLDRVAGEAAASAMATHVHPLGVDGAAVLATAVALSLQSPPRFDRRAFFVELAARATTEEFEWQLRTASKLTPQDSLSFGNSLEAHRSVTSAIQCFANHPDSYVDTVASAIGLGNDTDTLAAMAGALAGARLGTAGLPASSLALLENDDRGKDHIAWVAVQLAANAK